MRKELPKTYSPKEFEDRIYRGWCEAGYFKPDPDEKKPKFSIVIPPPNVTGQLHMGHALDQTLQDILVRSKRMQGFSTLWVPGTDHAGIATQIKVEENLRVNEGLTRYDLGREKFLERVWAWKQQYGDRIISQLKKLGSSCDWDHERFTMDEGCSRAVREVFVSLYEKGLIYKGNRIINWCPHCITALSDAEVEYTEQPGSFWHIRYPVEGSDEYVTIATTRPETLLGDTAVAVHPDDERYTHLVGRMLILPLVGRRIPVVADEYVEKDFGTGCVKITPAHDPNDFEVGRRHNLPVIRVMNDDATINAEGGKYCGLDRDAARDAIVRDLEEGGYLIKVEPHVHNVGTCYRCHKTVEPLTSDQWFVKMAPLAEPALEVVKNGTVSFHPERFTKTYTNWMENVHDWCISRQLWWGHRIPAFTCEDCHEMTVSREDITVCPRCGGKVTQESDVLDTWFSSALWPFSTMGWPDKTEDLARYYPTDVLVTGYDIIFFWVARMIFSALEHTGREPFHTVFIHGLVRDKLGRKMSKSLGNGIDPLEVIDKYGADALRYALAFGNSPGNDMRFSEEKIEAARNFANKLWNASRFVLMNLGDGEIPTELPDASLLRAEDKWILTRLAELTKTVRGALDSYELGVALSAIYDFSWDLFCDWYIELSKSRLAEGESETAKVAKAVLVFVLIRILRLLHPFMPFITEEIYGSLTEDGGSIMVSPFPTVEEIPSFPEDADATERMIAAIRAIRTRRAEMMVPPSRRTAVYIVTPHAEEFAAAAPYFQRLASATSVEILASYDRDDAVTLVTDAATVYIPMADMIDLEKEKARLEAELARADADIERTERKLENESFVAKAPAAVVDAERQKLEKFRATRASLIAELEKLR